MSGIRKHHTCTSIAEGCVRSTMSTYKTRIGRMEGHTHKPGTKTKCGACAENVAMGRPQHALQ